MPPAALGEQRNLFENYAEIEATEPTLLCRLGHEIWFQPLNDVALVVLNFPLYRVVVHRNSVYHVARKADMNLRPIHGCPTGKGLCFRAPLDL
jgi:hypothetical protein